jgi:hypothetical protein
MSVTLFSLPTFSLAKITHLHWSVMRKPWHWTLTYNWSVSGVAPDKLFSLRPLPTSLISTPTSLTMTSFVEKYSFLGMTFFFPIIQSFNEAQTRGQRKRKEWACVKGFQAEEKTVSTKDILKGCTTGFICSTVA